MFKSKAKTDPLVVQVTKNRWDALGDPTSKQQMMQYQILQRQGGINESVSPGTYHFRVYRKGFRIIAELELAPQQ